VLDAAPGEPVLAAPVVAEVLAALLEEVAPVLLEEVAVLLLAPVGGVPGWQYPSAPQYPLEHTPPSKQL
jgi:hypothetical protein